MFNHFIKVTPLRESCGSVFLICKLVGVLVRSWIVSYLFFSNLSLLRRCNSAIFEAADTGNNTGAYIDPIPVAPDIAFSSAAVFSNLELSPFIRSLIAALTSRPSLSKPKAPVVTAIFPAGVFKNCLPFLMTSVAIPLVLYYWSNKSLVFTIPDNISLLRRMFPWIKLASFYSSYITSNIINIID